jgi:cobalamin biosynthesis protein CbiG
MSNLADEVVRSTEALTDTVDAAAVALARLYAEEIDGAAAWRARADKAARRALAEDGPEGALYLEVEALRAKLSERTALAGLGQRLERLLVELQATPKARGRSVGAPAGAPSKLANLRVVP